MEKITFSLNHFEKLDELSNSSNLTNQEKELIELLKKGKETFDSYQQCTDDMIVFFAAFAKTFPNSQLSVDCVNNDYIYSEIIRDELLKMLNYNVETRNRLLNNNTKIKLLRCILVAFEL